MEVVARGLSLGYGLWYTHRAGIMTAFLGKRFVWWDGCFMLHSENLCIFPSCVFPAWKGWPFGSEVDAMMPRFVHMYERQK